MTAAAFRSLRSPSGAAAMRPVAPLRLIESAYSEDQYHRLLGVVREHGSWKLILAENFERPEEMKTALDQRDDLTHEHAIGMLIDDILERGITFDLPTDSMNDRAFVRLVSQVCDIGVPANVSPSATDEPAAA